VEFGEKLNEKAKRLGLSREDFKIDVKAGQIWDQIASAGDKFKPPDDMYKTFEEMV
jgi:hypothetical protein